MNAKFPGIIALILFLALFLIAASHARNGRGNDPAKNVVSERLESVGYLPYVEEEAAPGKLGVTVYDQEYAYTGVNLYTPQRLGVAYLIGMDGSVLHEWKAPEGVPDDWVSLKIIDRDNVVVMMQEHLMGMGWDSSIKWVDDNRYHHDFTVAENGDIYALAKKSRYYRKLGGWILDDYIIVLDRDGEVKKSISVYELLGGDFVSKRARLNETADVFHTNTIDIIDHDIEVGERGDFILCFRHLDMIAVVDLEKEEIVWSWGEGILDRPHHPTVLEDGNILVFDNGNNRGYSRVVEYDPGDDKIVWEYVADKRKSFFTSERGGSQRLPNGNTLITESNKGHVFEVTEKGEIVWEYWLPEKHENGRRATLYRMARLDEETLTPLNGVAA
ncbi:MAG: arylsulfotransferase family protein [Candidatus Altiarchaeota archaeon]